MNDLQRETQQLWDYLAVADEPAPSDAIFVFGGPLLAMPERAAALFAAGFAPVILVAGHSGTHDDSGWDRPSAVVFAEHLRALGVPDAAVIVQAESTNTLEDVRFGMPLLLARIGPPRRLIAVSRPLHQRRALATIRGAYPAPAYLSCPCAEPSPLACADPERVAAMARRALGEIDRLGRYAAQGNLERQEIPPAIALAAQRVAELLGPGAG